MSKKFTEYKGLDLSKVSIEILSWWEEHKTFEKSLEIRKGCPDFIFYEGPPSANGLPGIHHVISRTLKDIFCRYKTMKGYRVDRKAGWDTHGLPVELGVEKMLGITKEDIGKKISIEEYNQICRREVMKYTDAWEDITKKMGYWLSMENPYITYDNRYIETLWHLLKRLYEKGFLYKGYTIQPYSPAAGTGLSTHELNYAGCYRDVKDVTVVALFKVIRNSRSEFLFDDTETDIRIMAWTTTPWTLLSNTALAMGANIDYVKVRTFNPYTKKPVTVILAKDRFSAYFSEKDKELSIEDFNPSSKQIPYNVLAEYKGKDFELVDYEQLLPYSLPETGDAFKVLNGDFVSTGDGTGIVHIAPSFGADDFNIARKYGIGALTLVDKHGKFTEGAGEFSGRFVKNEYDSSIPEGTNTVDVDIAVKLKQEDKAFRIEKYVHSYPHCWRTDKPILYYPLDSWFIRTTAVKDRLIELNNTINWKPKATGQGRFGKWLENLMDWNLSRSRYWGTPLPIWRTEDGKEQKCIGSVAELKNEIEKSIQAGFMKNNSLSKFREGDFSKDNYSLLDLHRPFVDHIILVSDTGKKMMREPDLIDVWFDSGAMPYAQIHYPFEHEKDFSSFFPAEYISEGVDQTRGWFFTLHAISTLISDSVCYKNVISHGLVLDKEGQKMSKRLGNAVDPFQIIKEYGADPVRWYMITNSQPWDNLKFDKEGVEEVKRKFFGTLYNTYAFFALYANVDGFIYKEKDVAIEERPEIDRWILSRLNSLVKETGEYYDDYEPTKAGRSIQHFVTEYLSNWYVRLSRKRFWGGEFTKDKISAYQTLYTCIETVARLACPIVPFYTERLFTDLNDVTGKQSAGSVHLLGFPEYQADFINKELEEKMETAQLLSSMILGLRRKVNIKVRQPLQKIRIPLFNPKIKENIESVRNLILTETNIKEIEYILNTNDIIVKKIKPDFKKLGPRYGRLMKEIAGAISRFNQEEIIQFENKGSYLLQIQEEKIELQRDDVEIQTEDIPGWLVATEGSLTVALDIFITPALKEEGMARELINRIQHLRKEKGFEVTDKIILEIQKNIEFATAVEHFKEYICLQTLAVEINIKDKLEQNESVFVEVDNQCGTFIKINKIN